MVVVRQKEMSVTGKGMGEPGRVSGTLLPAPCGGYMDACFSIIY